MIILGVRWLVTVVSVQERLSLVGDCEMNLYKLNYIANLKDLLNCGEALKIVCALWVLWRSKVVCVDLNDWQFAMKFIL